MKSETKNNKERKQRESISGGGRSAAAVEAENFVQLGEDLFHVHKTVLVVVQAIKDVSGRWVVDGLIAFIGWVLVLDSVVDVFEVAKVELEIQKLAHEVHGIVKLDFPWTACVNRGISTAVDEVVKVVDGVEELSEVNDVVSVMVGRRPDLFERWVFDHFAAIVVRESLLKLLKAVFEFLLGKRLFGESVDGEDAITNIFFSFR